MVPLHGEVTVTLVVWLPGGVRCWYARLRCIAAAHSNGILDNPAQNWRYGCLSAACLSMLFQTEEEELTFKGGTYKRECSKLREKENYMYICLYFEGDILGLWVHLQLLKIQ